MKLHRKNQIITRARRTRHLTDYLQRFTISQSNRSPSYTNVFANMVVTETVYKLLIFYTVLRFISVFTSRTLWTSFQATCYQTTSSQPDIVKLMLIFFSNVSANFLSYFLAKTLLICTKPLCMIHILTYLTRN
jgi:hypothetical protein